MGTRNSLLARTQTNWVAAQLQTIYTHLEIQIVEIQTTGDQRRDVPFAQVGTKGMFVKEIEQALLQGQIDVGVHSLKDMPSDLPEGLTLACVPEREEPWDALISPYGNIASLPPGATVGTSSVRRQAQLRLHRPDLRLIELRGNLDTRLRKLDAGEYDAILLACAGLQRMGLAHRITQRLPLEICVPAVGQGALALEIRSHETATTPAIHDLLAPLNHPPSADAVTAERGFQRALEGGCTVPAGAVAFTAEDRIEITALIANAGGTAMVRETLHGRRSEAEDLGRTLAVRLLAGGGSRLLEV